jgi:hypothetical protein
MILKGYSLRAYITCPQVLKAELSGNLIKSNVVCSLGIVDFVPPATAVSRDAAEVLSI